MVSALSGNGRFAATHQMIIADEILEDYDSYDDLYVLEPVPEPESLEKKKEKPKIQRKMTNYFRFNSKK